MSSYQGVAEGCTAVVNEGGGAPAGGSVETTREDLGTEKINVLRVVGDFDGSHAADEQEEVRAEGRKPSLESTASEEGSLSSNAIPLDASTGDIVDVDNGIVGAKDGILASSGPIGSLKKKKLVKRKVGKKKDKDAVASSPLEEEASAVIAPPPLLHVGSTSSSLAPESAIVGRPWDLLRAVVLSQCMLRRKLARLRVAKVKKRASVMKELAMTENSYLFSLRLATAEYLAPLRRMAGTSEEILSGEKLKVIFADNAMERIVALSKKMLVEFTKRVSPVTVYSRIGEVFLGFQEQMSCYADFVVNYDIARKALSAALDDPKGALSFFDRAVQKKHGIKLGIRDFLIMPVQRIPRYILLLRDILKHTPRNDPDYEGIVAATEMLTRFTSNMDTEAQRVESLRIVESKLSGLDMKDLVADKDRRLLHQGSLVDSSSERRLYLFLLSDMLLVAQETNSDQQRGTSSRIFHTFRGRSSTVSATAAPPAVRGDEHDAQKMEVVAQVALTQYTRVTAMKSFETTPLYLLKIGSATYQCVSDEERQIWMSHIHRAVQDIRKKVLESGETAPSPRASSLLDSPSSPPVLAPKLTDAKKKERSGSVRESKRPGASGLGSLFGGILPGLKSPGLEDSAGRGRFAQSMEHSGEVVKKAGGTSRFSQSMEQSGADIAKKPGPILVAPEMVRQVSMPSFSEGLILQNRISRSPSHPEQVLLASPRQAHTVEHHHSPSVLHHNVCPVCTAPFPSKDELVAHLEGGLCSASSPRGATSLTPEQPSSRRASRGSSRVSSSEEKPLKSPRNIQ